MDGLEERYKKLIFIRMFEQKILELFERNLLSGTTHTCIGQEHVAVAAMNQCHLLKQTSVKNQESAFFYP